MSEISTIVADTIAPAYRSITRPDSAVAQPGNPVQARRRAVATRITRGRM